MENQFSCMPSIALIYSHEIKCNEILWKPVSTVLVGNIYWVLVTCQKLLAFSRNHTLNSHNNPLKQFLCSLFYWEGNWDVKRLWNLPTVQQVARGWPRFQCVSTEPECLLLLPTRRRWCVPKLWDLPLNFAETNRKWITQSFFILCLDSRKQPITH